MSIVPAEAVFDYRFQSDIPWTGDLSRTFEGWRYRTNGDFGFGPHDNLSEHPQPGDFLIAMVVTRTDSYGSFAPNHRVVDDSGNELADWVQDVDWQFDDPGSGFTGFTDDAHTPWAGRYAVAVFRKEWTSGDDYDTYYANFIGYNNLIGAEDGTYAEVQMSMYMTHGHDGACTFHGNSEELAYTSPFAGALTTFNYGDGESRMGNIEYNPEHNAFGDWSYHPGTALGYYSFTGCNVYYGAQFGTWSFGVGPEVGGFYGPGEQTFEPYDQVDQDWDGPNQTPTIGRSPFESFSLFILDVKQSDVIRISSHRIRHRLSVS